MRTLQLANTMRAILDSLCGENNDLLQTIKVSSPLVGTFHHLFLSSPISGTGGTGELGGWAALGPRDSAVVPLCDYAPFDSSLSGPTCFAFLFESGAPVESESIGKDCRNGGTID